MFKTYYQSPIGILEICGNEKGLSSISFVNKTSPIEKTSSCLNGCLTQLDEYFKGKRKDFSLKLNIQGTDFQKKTWRELIKIPFGETKSYLQIATQIGNKKAVRAVGNTNRINKFAVVVPCHRVIGANGKLTGYAAGLWRKQWLLDFEKNIQTKLF